MGLTIAARLLAGILALMVPTEAAQAQKPGGILKVYHIETPPSASLLEETTNSAAIPFMGIYNNLVMFDPAQERNTLASIVPDLAKSWAWSPDARRLTMQLNDGVTWHDGKSFSSADVKCTWDMLQGRSPARQGMRKHPRELWWHNLAEVTADGPAAVTFHLQRPQPSFLMLLAAGYQPGYPCHVTPAVMRRQPVGTGPFEFVSMKPNESITLKRNARYWKLGHPFLDGIEYTIMANRATRILAFTSGNVDLTFPSGDVSVPLLQTIKAQVPAANCKLAPTNVAGNLIVNPGKPPFDDPRLRRAMQIAIDRPAFVQIISEGHAITGGALLPPPAGQWGLPPEQLLDLPGYGPDLAQRRSEAQAIMRSLGYGPDKPLRVKIEARNLVNYRDPAIILIDQLKQIYIEATLELVETAVWSAKVQRGDYTIGMNMTGSGIDDPDSNFYENYTCNSARNITRYCNPEIDRLIDAQSAELDPVRRQRRVWEIDRRLQLDGARPMIMHNVAATCMHPYVKGLVLPVNTVYNHWRMENVWLDR